LIDTSQYSGCCLPGFLPVTISEQQESNQSLVNNIDHIAFAMPQHSALSTIVWYEKVFGMKQFIVNQYVI
jgi:4-hydroxyphenylpyruvate dioxygenase-like putative hemolysin